MTGSGAPVGLLRLEINASSALLAVTGAPGYMVEAVRAESAADQVHNIRLVVHDKDSPVHGRKSLSGTLSLPRRRREALVTFPQEGRGCD